MTRAMRLWLWWAAIALFPPAGAAQSPDTNIVSDGTLGTVVTETSPTSLAITGGTAAGTNLFHSFGEFNLGAGDSAVYQVGSAVANVISRVTGGHPSLISGAVSAQITGTGETSAANFFFLNPHGVVFNSSQGVDTNGAFFVTSAQELRFADGTVFGAGTPASSLTMAAPESFGFLSGARGRVGPESIDFVGDVISLANDVVFTNRAIHFAGRAVSLTDSHLASFGGIWFDTRSLDIDRSTLEISARYSYPPPDPDPEHDPRFHIAAHRWVRLVDSALISPYSIDLVGGAVSMTDSGLQGDGGIWIDASSLEMYRSTLGVEATHSAFDPRLHIAANRWVRLVDSDLYALSFDFCCGPPIPPVPIEIRADELSMVRSVIGGVGGPRPDAITIEARQVRLSDQSKVSWYNYYGSGVLRFRVSDRMVVEGGSSIFVSGDETTLLLLIEDPAGVDGSLRVDLLGDSELGAFVSYPGGSGGHGIEIHAHTLNLVDSKLRMWRGRSDSISIAVQRLLLSGSEILIDLNDTLSSGGNIDITASDLVRLVDSTIAAPSSPQSLLPYRSARGGNVSIDGSPTLILDNSTIDARGYDRGGDVTLGSPDAPLRAAIFRGDSAIDVSATQGSDGTLAIYANAIVSPQHGGGRGHGQGLDPSTFTSRQSTSLPREGTPPPTPPRLDVTQALAWPSTAEGLALDATPAVPAAQALDDYRGRAETARRNGRPADVAVALSQEARAAIELERFDVALGLLREARQAVDALEASPERAYLGVHVAKSYESLAKAAPAHRREAMLAAHGALIEAHALALSIGDRRAQSFALGNLGGLYELDHRAEEALLATQRALRTAEWAHDADALSRWHWQLAHLLWERGDESEAIASYQRAVELLESAPAAS